MASKQRRRDIDDDPGPQRKAVKSPQGGTCRRPDVTKRHQDNACLDFSVVKTSLNSFCTDAARALPWEDVLHDMNQMVLEAYVLANVHVVRQCSRRSELGQHLVPTDELNQSFFSRCLSSVAGRSNLGDENFQRSVSLYNAWRAVDARRASNALISSGWQQFAAQQMASNADEAVRLNFGRRFNQQLQRCYHINGREASEMLESILAPDYDGADDEVFAWRQRVPRDRHGHLDYKPHRLLPLTFIFLKDIEECNRRAAASTDVVAFRGFTLLLTKKGFTYSHFTMCDRGLWAMMRRAGLTTLSRDAWIPEAETWWRRLFDISKFETTNRRFARQVQTDGKAVSIVLRKPRQEPVEQRLDERDYDVQWGLDPGRRDLFVATNHLGETQRCSTASFYEAATYTKSNQKIKTWQRHHPDIRDAIDQMPTKRTASLSLLEAYVRFVTPRMDTLFEFAASMPFRKLKLRRYIFSKKKLRALCLKLTEQAGRRTVVGYGDWSNIDRAGFIKGRVSGPVKRLERELKQHCRVVSIDVFRTSKLHAECHRELSPQHSLRKMRDDTERTVEAYSVRHCRSIGCRGATVNRDVNASRNMLMLLQVHLRGLPRPLPFSRY